MMYKDEMIDELLVKFFDCIGNVVAPIAGEIVGALKRDKQENSPFYKPYENNLPREKGSAEILVFTGNKETKKEERTDSTTGQITEDKGIFQITKEDIKKMPKTIKNGKFFTEGFSVCYRVRKTGKNSFTYNVRFKKCGFNIDFSEKKKENLKPRFISILKKQAEEMELMNASGVPITFNAFSMYYFENVRKKKVTQSTYKTDLNRYDIYLKPAFKEKKIKEILPTECQRIIDGISESGKEKTADDVYSLLNGIFKFAISNYIIERNPLSPVVHTQHEREHGKALTKEEEKALLFYAKSSSRRLISFAVALYTGLRPNEYTTAKIEGDFIVAVNSKRKTKKIEYKKIPISPMLKPYLQNIKQLEMLGTYQMRDIFKEILPNHKLYDLRTTFYTRCQECGVAEVALKKFAGHSLGGLADTYTDLSDEFLLREGNKLCY